MTIRVYLLVNDIKKRHFSFFLCLLVFPDLIKPSEGNLYQDVPTDTVTVVRKCLLQVLTAAAESQPFLQLSPFLHKKMSVLLCKR